jgi:DNA-binding XRE family transcriptional regulator
MSDAPEPARITEYWQRKTDGSEPYHPPFVTGWEHSFRTGHMIRAARAMAGWTQADLAREAGLHVRTIKKWESEPTPWRKGYALSRMQAALARHGVIVFLRPAPGVRYAKHVTGTGES